MKTDNGWNSFVTVGCGVGLTGTWHFSHPGNSHQRATWRTGPDCKQKETERFIGDIEEDAEEERVVQSVQPEYLVRPREGRIMTIKTSSRKHLCIVTWFWPDLRRNKAVVGTVQEMRSHWNPPSLHLSAPTPWSAFDCGCSLMLREVGRRHGCRTVVGLISARDALPSGYAAPFAFSPRHITPAQHVCGGGYVKEKKAAQGWRARSPPCAQLLRFLLPRVAMCRLSAARRLQRISLSTHGDLYDNLHGITAQPARVTEGKSGRVWRKRVKE